MIIYTEQKSVHIIGYFVFKAIKYTLFFPQTSESNREELFQGKSLLEVF